MSIWGSCIVPFVAWEKVKYNENIDTYGQEDNEFYLCLRNIGYRNRKMNADGVFSIPHSDNERMMNYTHTVEDIPRLKKENTNKFRIHGIY